MNATILSTDTSPASSCATPIDTYIASLRLRLSQNREGEVATYIPELSRVEPDLLGIAIATVDGHVYQTGDAAMPFTIQSVSKPFLYGYALKILGRERVRSKVGVEPTGEAFNSIVLDEVNNRPFNPMVNAGAIAISSLVPGATQGERVGAMLDLLSGFAGRTLDIDEQVFASETLSGHRNRAIAYLMLNTGMVERDVDEVLELYFKQCSVRVTCTDLALMAATLANAGVQPRTREVILGEEEARDVLTIMSTCGMYDYAGQWSYDVGLPAKSGVSGAIIAVIPGQLGIAIYSPRLDAYGNSVRGILACKGISEDFSLHGLLVHNDAGAVIRRIYGAHEVSSNRRRPADEIAVLEKKGAAVIVIELQGSLFFAAVERLIRSLSSLSQDARMIILDLKRVQFADAAACTLLRQIIEQAQSYNCTIALSHVADGWPGRFGDLEEVAQANEVLVFAETDAALEFGEDRLIAQEVPVKDRTRFALARMDVFKGLDAQSCRELEQIISPRRFDAGTMIVREGDQADVFYVVARGSVSVQLQLSDGRTKRIAVIGPGLTFGEMALFDGGRRSADVMALETVIAYGVSVEGLRALGRDHPKVLLEIYANISRDLSERLRRANAEIRALA